MLVLHANHKLISFLSLAACLTIMVPTHNYNILNKAFDCIT